MKKLIAIICAALIALSALGCDNKTDTAVTGTDTEVTSRLENSIELQKNLFIGTIKSVETKQAVIAKFNIDISEYTVYTVDVTQSLDGVTPTGEIKVYCVGTAEQFINRKSMRKDETYFIDAQPWVYGNELVYLLSIYTVAYPRVDISGNVTLETESGGLLDCGSFDSYVESYSTAKTNVGNRIEGFFEPKQTVNRILEMAQEIKDKNTNTDFYKNGELKFEWTPSDEFIKTTADTSEKFYNEVKRVSQLETVTENDIKSLYTYLKEN